MSAWQPAAMAFNDSTLPTLPLEDDECMAANNHSLESNNANSAPEDEGMAASGLGNTVPSGSLKVIWGGNVPFQGTHEPCPSPPS